MIPRVPVRLQPLDRTLAWDVETASIRVWNDSMITCPDNATHYVFGARGTAEIMCGSRRFSLYANMYAAIPGACVVGGEGVGLVITHRDYVGIFQLGGPIEAKGRLRYIDGCTDSLLLAPPVLGDPCFNHLHIPAWTTQTRHHHPSVRIGMIVRGAGRCVTDASEFALTPGLVFMLEADLPHHFCAETESLDVVVYHPETDTGPTDEDHPMRNRTITTHRKMER
jgi:mannose-6-phosphate isomerase-like protein (cupin superfamily)